MSQKSPSSTASSPASRIIGSGEMAALVRAYNWASTPLGPIESWSKELLTIVNLVLSSPSPARAMWGPELILIYNDAYRSFPGPRHPWALGKSAREVYVESWPTVGPLLENALATGETLFYEKFPVPLPTEAGVRDSYLNYSFNPIYEDGKIAGLFGQLHDVTGEVTAEMQLRESEARSKRILQSIGDAVIVTDAETRITAMNPVAEDLTGWTFANAEGHLLSEVFSIVHETTRQPSENPAEKVMRLGSIVGLANHTILLRRDGSETAIDDSGAPIRDTDGKLTGIVLVFRDVTQQRADQESLRLQNEQAERQRVEIETLYRTAPIGLALFDAEDFRYLRLNDRQAAFFGLKPEDIIGQTVTEMAPIEGLRELFEQVARGEPVINYPLEGTLITDPSDYRYWNVSYSPVYAADGSIWAITAASMEITAQRKAEAALIQSEKLAVVGRLASSIAHEINNPLEAVTNLLYLAQTSNDIAEIKEFLVTTERELRRVSAIANQTLRFHKQASSPQAITASALFDSVLSIYQGRTINTGVQIDRRDRAATSVRCFDGEIRQVISNLVSNALDAMARNPGRLLLRSREATHWPSGERGLVLTVADTGIGITPEAKDRIFKPFFTTKSITGTGLGLWVSKEIVDRHHGFLRLRTSQKPSHHGTVFTLFLPFKAVMREEA